MTGPLTGIGPHRLLQRLRRLRLLARAALLFEQVWPALWPPFGVVGLSVCVALLDLPRRLPPLLHAGLLAAALLAVAVLLWRGLRGVRLPSSEAADRRLEQDSGLRHRPLSVLADRPALPGAEALWRAHMARAVAQLAGLRLGLPRPGLAARDPRALRAGLLVALAACLGIAGPETPSRLLRAALPHFGPAAATAASELQAWITPPGYTGLPPLFLRPQGGAVSLPAGSHLTVSLSGGSGAPALTLDAAELAFPAVDAGSFQADADLNDSGRLTVRRNGRDLAAWDLTVVADAAPLVRWSEPPGAARGANKAPATRLPWEVSHTYGVTGLQAELRLAVRQDAPPLILPIPLPGGSAKAAKGVKTQDLTAHPWAGIAVIGKLVAHDAPGLSGSSDEVNFVLPERHFDNAVARALLAIRKTLSLWPQERLQPGSDLDRIAKQDGVWRADLAGLLNLRAIIAEILHTRGDAAVEDAQARLWQLALHLEEGGLDRTARELAAARQAVKQAIEAQKRGEQIDPKELDKRIAELEAAIQKHLDALAEELRRDPDSQMADADQKPLDAQAMKDLAEQLRQLEQQGKPEAAEQKLAELEKLLDKLQAAKPQHRDAAQRQKAEKRKRGQEEMSALQDMVQREGGLLDRATARANPGRSNAPPGETDAQRQTDQKIQQALRRATGELMQQFGDLTGEVPPNLGDADAAMHGAITALGKARDAPAATSMQAAIEALQKGGQSMSELLAQQFGNPGDQQGDDGEGQTPSAGAGDGQGDGQDGQQGRGTGNRPWNGQGDKGRRSGQRTDPLGRPLREGSTGNSESADVALPQDMEQARTRAIQEELRKRGGEKTRPQPELDYIDRLLKQF